MIHGRKLWLAQAFRNNMAGKHMETENYLQMMIDSMQKKKVILKQIIVFNEEQEALLKEEDFNGAAFQKNMENKSDCIDELDTLDEGFQMIYDRIKADVNEYKVRYKEDIKLLQQLIKEVTELGVTIQAQESRNRVKADMKFRQLRQETKAAKRNISMASTYYRNMSGISSEPQFMDQKK